MARYGGEIVGASLAGTRTLEGEPQTGLLIIHRWSSAAGAQGFWDSDEYAPLKRLRHEACDSRISVFEGPPPQFAATD